MSDAALNAGTSTRLRPVERGRGQWGMSLFIATEAMLFVLLFFAYFYLAASQPRWPLTEDPSFILALVLLAILLVSSFTAAWGKRGIEAGNSRRLNLGIGMTLILAVAFLIVQVFEYRHHLEKLTPTDSAYGSIFYTITTLHLAHVIGGFGLLAFVLARGLAGHFTGDRHLAADNAVLYWHFVDVVWLLVVAVLYVLPHFYGPP